MNKQTLTIKTVLVCAVSSRKISLSSANNRTLFDLFLVEKKGVENEKTTRYYWIYLSHFIDHFSWLHICSLLLLLFVFIYWILMPFFVHCMSRGNNAPQSIETMPSVASSSSSTTKKQKTSTSSLASVFRSRASSPIEKMRNFIKRSSSKSAIQKVTDDEKSENEKELNEQIEKMRKEIESTRIELKNANEIIKIQTTKELKNAEQQSDKIIMNDVATMTIDTENNIKLSSPKSDKENMNPRQPKLAEKSPEIICIEDIGEKMTIKKLENEVAKLKKENEEQKEDFRRTRKDFILILKEAVLRKNEAENISKSLSRTMAEDEDWAILMSQHRHTLRRNVLLMWAQKKLEPFSNEIQVSNFSSDWTDCRAFCAIIYEFFPDLLTDISTSPIEGNCIERCRKAFEKLEIPFNEKSLGISNNCTDLNDSSILSSTIGLPDWRYIMETVFSLYKKGVLGK